MPDQPAIDAVLPLIGVDKVALSNGQLRFGKPGMELDFGGLGKEYAADRAAEICIELGARHGFVDLGGDIRVIGPQPDDLPWKIGIRHPHDAGRLAAEISLFSGALATSGDYERFMEVDSRRYCHILEPPLEPHTEGFLQNPLRMVLGRYDGAGCHPGRLWRGVLPMVDHTDGYPLRHAN